MTTSGSRLHCRHRSPGAIIIIAEAVLAMQHSVSSENLQNTIHAHPTLAEAVHEAGLATDKRSIDFINR
jgi:dihydrolipoamide dehydrogenase